MQKRDDKSLTNIFQDLILVMHPKHSTLMLRVIFNSYSMDQDSNPDLGTDPATSMTKKIHCALKT